MVYFMYRCIWLESVDPAVGAESERSCYALALAELPKSQPERTESPRIHKVKRYGITAVM